MTHSIGYLLFTSICLVLFTACGSTKKAQDALPLTHPAGWTWDGGQPYHIHFSPEGKINLKLDVNSCFGAYSLTGSQISVSPEMGCTEACCDKPEGMKLSRDLMNVTSYNIQGSTLTLQTPQTTLRFSAKTQP